eukprot:XP_011668457.1 PREDICTED: uncharacterized protein LOC105440232 [Strongylocentrotus purpuratus]
MEGTYPCEDGTKLDINSSWWWADIEIPASSTYNCVTLSHYFSSLFHVLCDQSYRNLCEVKPTTTIQSPGFFSLAKDNKGRPLIGHCLTDHVIKTVLAKTKLRCAAECIHEVGCKSINYKDGVCELNEETRASELLSSYFSQYDGCSYYELI